MYSNKSLIVFILTYFWQLPQHLLATVLLIIYRNDIKEIRYYNHTVIFIMKKYIGAGTSLGSFIFIKDIVLQLDNKVIKHEYGHSIQSLFFGWLYLIIIGIPSLCNYIIDLKNRKGSFWYYNRYPENFADKLGGVNRYGN